MANLTKDVFDLKNLTKKIYSTLALKFQELDKNQINSIIFLKKSINKINKVNYLLNQINLENILESEDNSNNHIKDLHKKALQSCNMLILAISEEMNSSEKINKLSINQLKRNLDNLKLALADMKNIEVYEELSERESKLRITDNE